MGKKGQFLPLKLRLRTKILAFILLLELGVFPYSFPRTGAKTAFHPGDVSEVQVASIKAVSEYPTALPTAYDSIFPPQLPTVTPTNVPIKRKTALLAVAPRSVKPAQADTHGLIEKYGRDYGVSPELLKQIAACESGFRAEAINGPYGGMFQFLASTWASNRKAMGDNPDPDLRFNAEESIRTAAFKISRDGAGAWPVCGKVTTATL